MEDYKSYDEARKTIKNLIYNVEEDIEGLEKQRCNLINTKKMLDAKFFEIVRDNEVMREVI